MNYCIILNPTAGSAEQGEALRSALSDRTEYVCWETQQAGDATVLARRALDEGFEHVVAAGGDGTIHEVVNGLLGHARSATLGVLPLGTGNDLARTLGIPVDPGEAVDVLVQGRTARLDAIHVTSGDKETCAVNAAAGGFSGQVDEAVTTEMKDSWGPLAYLIGAASVLPDLQDYETHVTFDDEEPQVIEALNVICANGRTVAGGIMVAPVANPEDGLLDVVIVKACSVIEMAEISARLLAGNYLNSPHVLHRRARKVRVDSEPGMWFNVDGELFSQEAIRFEVHPGAIETVVGPTYQAAPTLPVQEQEGTVSPRS